MRLALMAALALAAVALFVAPALARVPRSPAVVARLDAADGSPCTDQAYADFNVDGAPRLWQEVAATEEQRQVGLMFRESMPQDSGMLFSFQQQSRGGFWMHNTLLPFSIAWLDQDSTIVDIQDMEPLTDTVHTPVAPYWYAIEANQGWYAANSVMPGAHVTLCVPAT
jgi:uncharacterized membrane protein (UPF0127 family)